MSFLKKLFGKKEKIELQANNQQSKEKEIQKPNIETEKLIEEKENEGYTSLGRSIFPQLINTEIDASRAILDQIDPAYVFDFFEHIKVIIAIQSNGGSGYLTKEITNQIGIPKEEIYSTALRNLMSTNGGAVKIVNCNFPQPILKNIKRIMIGSEFDSSLVLIDGFLAQYSAQIKDETLVVSMPKNNILLVNGFSDFNGAMGLQKITENMFREDNPQETKLYPEAIIWKKEGWSKFPKGGNNILDMMGDFN
ncbi:MAG: hypothetical protein P1U56_18400 [Saprospiraceae bacterium]|nr:hypothetical protein [Saprospiraceae bacterium]